MKKNLFYNFIRFLFRGKTFLKEEDKEEYDRVSILEAAKIVYEEEKRTKNIEDKLESKFSSLLNNDNKDFNC